HFQEAEAADGSPAHIFDQTIGWIGLRRNHHGAAGVLAIVEGQEEAAPLVPTFISIGTHAETTPLELHHAHEHAQEISQVPKWLEDAVSQRTDVRGKSHAQ